MRDRLLTLAAFLFYMALSVAAYFGVSWVAESLEPKVVPARVNAV